MPVKEAIEQWLERCAIRKCEQTNQDTLVAKFGNFVIKALQGIPLSEATSQMRTELAELSTAPSNHRLVGFIDLVFYDSGTESRSADTSAIKSKFLGFVPGQREAHVTYRLLDLIKQRLIREHGVRITRIIDSSDGEAYTTTRYWEPQKVSETDLIPSIDELLDYSSDQNIPPSAVADLLQCPEFGETAQRLIWLRNYSYLYSSDKVAKKNGVSQFVGIDRSQIYNKVNHQIELLKKWMQENYPESGRNERIDFCRQVFDAIDEGLHNQCSIPKAWYLIIRNKLEAKFEKKKP